MKTEKRLMSDLYQMIAYCAGLAVHRAILVHATVFAARSVLGIEFGEIEINVTGLDLAAPLPELRAQIDALAQLIDPLPVLAVSCKS